MDTCDQVQWKYRDWNTKFEQTEVKNKMFQLIQTNESKKYNINKIGWKCSSIPIHFGSTRL